MPDRNKHYPIDKRLRSNLQSLVEQSKNLNGNISMPNFRHIIKQVLAGEFVFLMKE